MLSRKVSIYRGYKFVFAEPEHRLIWEATHMCCLLPDAVVHHIDENPLNNHPDNLQGMTRAEHNRLHYDGSFSYRKDMTDRFCLFCHSSITHVINNYQQWYHYNDGFVCRNCYRFRIVIVSTQFSRRSSLDGDHR